ncbi:MAG: hypothetical protein LUC32_04295 [Clostridiales bacterium]|nr:hypothetical protein [Clostridiales bacterium]
MRPVVQGRRITYSAPDGVPIMRYLGGGISVNDFFLIIAQVVEVTKKIDRNGFNINCLVLDYSYVFVNLLTKEVHFIYQPILTQNVSQNIFSFLYDLVFHTVLKPTEDRGIMDRFVDRLHRLQTYRPSDVEQILLMLYPAVYKQFQRSKTGQSGMLSDKKWANGGKRGDSDENPTRLLDEDENATGYMSGDDDATGLLNGDAADMGFSPFWDGSGSAGGFADGSEQATGLLDEDEQATGLLDSGYATGLPDEDGPALLG